MFGKAGVPAHFTHHAEDSDRAELFEDIRIMKDARLPCGRLSERLMRANGLYHSGDLGFREAPTLQKIGGSMHGIRHIIPRFELGQVFRSMAGKHTQIMQPGCGVDHVIIMRVILGQKFGQGVKTELVFEFIRRNRFALDILDDRFSKMTLFHGRSDSSLPR